MTWSMRVGTLFGIPLHMHLTFVLLLGVLALAALFQTGSLIAAVSTVVFVSAIFGCVVLHELGHALAARRYGIRTLDVTLLPIGGLARLERMPSDPRQELWIALAGPAVNVAIAGVLGMWLAMTGAVGGLGLTAGSFAARLLTINIGLVAFNMLPAFPMDGGRVLRALLAQRMSYAGATDVAATVGKGMAILFGVAGLLWNPMLLFIALFVWSGATQEAMMARQRNAYERQTMVGDDDVWEMSPDGSGWTRGAPRVRRRVYRVGPNGFYVDQGY